jgi:hypothetical protein
MTSYVEQYTSTTGTSVVNITAGNSVTYSIKNVKVYNDESVIITTNINFQYFINENITIDILRNGSSIINGKQNLFNIIMNPDYAYISQNFTSTFTVIDTNPNSFNNYDFIITADNFTVSVFQAVFIANVINKNLISVNQQFPSSTTGDNVYTINPSTDLFINLPVNKIKKGNYSRLINACLNFIMPNAGLIEGEILDPTGNSLTNGLQKLTGIASNPNTTSYELNINFDIIDDNTPFDSTGNYQLHLYNANAVPPNTTDLSPYFIYVDFYSFLVYEISKCNIMIQDNYPIIDDPTSAFSIPILGSYTLKSKLKSNKKLRRFKLLLNVITDSIAGEHFLMIDVKKSGKSIINGAFPFIALTPAVEKNCQLEVYDKGNNINDEYEIELLNIGCSPLDIDYFNLLEISENGYLNIHSDNSIIPLNQNPGLISITASVEQPNSITSAAAASGVTGVIGPTGNNLTLLPGDIVTDSPYYIRNYAAPLVFQNYSLLTFTLNTITYYDASNNTIDPKNIYIIGSGNTNPDYAWFGLYFKTPDGTSSVGLIVAADGIITQTFDASGIVTETISLNHTLSTINQIYQINFSINTHSSSILASIDHIAINYSFTKTAPSS